MGTFEKTPDTCASPSWQTCRWYPTRTFRALLEALTCTPDIDRDVRGSLFRAIEAGMRCFAWPCRFKLYVDIIQKCRIDAVIGAVVTTFKEDWWSHVQAAVEKGDGLQEECQQL